MAMENYHGLATGIASGTALIGGSGNLVTISGATITVKDAGTANISSIFSDEGVTALANPFTADSSGRFNFYAADGDYDITVSKTGFTSYTLLDVLSNSNPTTTRGDILIRDATNTTARLAIGTDKQVLQSDGTDITWESNIAANITNVPAGNIVATDVQAAINELDGNDVGTIPTFHVRQSAGQSVATGADVKLTWDTEDFDTNSDFASNRFTPTVAGKYFFNANIKVSGATDQKFIWLKFRKNGATSYNTFSYQSAGSATGLSIVSSLILDMNGTTDYVEVFFQHDVGVNISLGTVDTYFEGFRIGGV